MKPETAKRLALMATVLGVFSAYIRKKDKPEVSVARAAFGGLVVAIILTTMADVSPEIAGPFTVLVLIVAATGALGAFQTIGEAR